MRAGVDQREVSWPPRSSLIAFLPPPFPGSTFIFLLTARGHVPFSSIHSQPSAQMTTPFGVLFRTKTIFSNCWIPSTLCGPRLLLQSVFCPRLEIALLMSTHGGHLLFWDDCHLESGDFLTVRLFLDKGEENWTKAGILSTSSSCGAEPIKTSRSCPAGWGRASEGPTPASCTAAPVTQTLRPGTGRMSPKASPWLSPPQCFGSVSDWLLSQQLSGCSAPGTPTCPHTTWSRRVPSGALRDQKGSWEANPSSQGH